VLCSTSSISDPDISGYSVRVSSVAGFIVVMVMIYWLLDSGRFSDPGDELAEGNVSEH
jgi:hypothetical protein